MRRDDKPALIALAMALCAIIAVALISNLLGNVDANGSGYDVGGQNGPDHQPDAPITLSDFTFYGDGLAQWVMVVVSVVATGVSLFAVVLVNRTLKTSQNATAAAVESLAVTREIGTRQLRPYIVYDGASLETLRTSDGSHAFIEVTARFRNCGLSPGVITAASSSVYAPTGNPGWKPQRAHYSPTRIVIGPNQTGDMRFNGIDRSKDGTFTWFSIGILIWYDSIDGSSYEDHVWLTFDGREMRQGYSTSGYALYRPEAETGGDQK